MAEEKRNEKEIVGELKRLEDLGDKASVENLLENNEMEFDVRDKKYRIKKLSFKQKQELAQKRIKKYNTLLQEKDDKGSFIHKTESELIELYKERGIDIDGMVKKFGVLEIKKQDYYLKLGELIKNKVPEQELEPFRKEIEKIKAEQRELSVKKTTLLDGTLEIQLLVFIYSYIAFLVTEIKVGDKWEKAFKTYKDFENTENQLIDEIIYYVSLMTGTGV